MVEGSQVRIRVDDRALHRNDELLVRELAAFLEHRGYFVQKVKGGLDVQPHNPVSERGDRQRLERDLDRWRVDHPKVELHVSRG